MTNVTTRSIIAKYRSVSTVKQIIRSTLNSDVVKGHSCDKSDFSDAEGNVYNIYGASNISVKLESWDWFQAKDESKKCYSVIRKGSRVISRILDSEGDRLIDFPVPVDARKMACKILGYRFLLSGSSCQTALGVLSSDLAFHSIATGHPDNAVFHTVDVIPVWGAGFNHAHGVRTKQMCDFDMSYFGYSVPHSADASMCLVRSEILRHGPSEIKKISGYSDSIKGNATLTHVMTHVYVDLATCVALMWNKLYHGYTKKADRVSALRTLLNHTPNDLGSTSNGLTQAMKYYLTRELASEAAEVVYADEQNAYDRDINCDVANLYAHLIVFVGDIINVLATLSLPILTSVLSEASKEDLGEAFRGCDLYGLHHPLVRVIQRTTPYLPAGSEQAQPDGSVTYTRFNPITSDNQDATHIPDTPLVDNV